MHAGGPGDLAPSKAVKKGRGPKRSESRSPGPAEGQRFKPVERLPAKDGRNPIRRRRNAMRGTAAGTQNQAKQTMGNKWISGRAGIVRIGTLALTRLCSIEYMYNTASVK